MQGTALLIFIVTVVQLQSPTAKLVNAALASVMKAHANATAVGVTFVPRLNHRPELQGAIHREGGHSATQNASGQKQARIASAG